MEETPVRRPHRRRPQWRDNFEQPDRGNHHWRALSSCSEHDNPDLWFSLFSTERLAAVRICMTCPVKTDCLSWALKTDQHFGVWGGRDLEVSHSARDAITRLPLVGRVRKVLDQTPGSTMEQMASRLGYKSADNLERTLRRRGDDGEELIRILGSRNVPHEQGEKVSC